MQFVGVKDLPIESLSSYPKNARVHNESALDESAEINGQYRSVVARALPDGTFQLLAGHGTRDAFARRGDTTIRVELIEADDAEALRINLADNGTSRDASYDDQLLAELLAAAEIDGGFAGTGWDESEYRKLVASLAPPPDVMGASVEPVWNDADIIAEAKDHFLAGGFPYPPIPRYNAMQQLNRLAETETHSLMGSIVAYHVADPYQPHRFETPIPGKCTPVEAFNDDVKIEHALKLALETGKLSPMSLLGTLAYVRGAQQAAQFRPGFALLMYRRFAPAGGTVLDTSTGYGGRLLGFIASHCSTYIGIDPETRTHAGNERMAADLCPAGKTVELHNLPAEDVSPDAVAGRCDFAFTSPPYFGKEQYSTEATQSWKRYPSGDAWRDGFLAPTLALQFAALKPGGVSAVNIADVKIGKTTYPLLDWTIEVGQAMGFEYVTTEQFPLGRVPGQGEAAEGFEPVVILGRPE
jgi:hypothetical protein